MLEQENFSDLVIQCVLSFEPTISIRGAVKEFIWFKSLPDHFQMMETYRRSRLESFVCQMVTLLGVAIYIVIYFTMDICNKIHMYHVEYLSFVISRDDWARRRWPHTPCRWTNTIMPQHFEFLALYFDTFIENEDDRSFQCIGEEALHFPVITIPSSQPRFGFVKSFAIKEHGVSRRNYDEALGR